MCLPCQKNSGFKTRIRKTLVMRTLASIYPSYLGSIRDVALNLSAYLPRVFNYYGAMKKVLSRHVFSVVLTARLRHRAQRR